MTINKINEDNSKKEYYKEYYKVYELNKEIPEILYLGPNNVFIKTIESCLQVDIFINDGFVYIKEDAFDERLVCKISNIFEAIELLINNDVQIEVSSLFSIIHNVDSSNVKQIASLYFKKDIIYTTVSGRSVYPKTLNQKLYIKALEDNDIVFGLGPAGTGKTFLAVMFALKYLKTFKARRIVLVRPIVEAGEKLGFLPGDLKEKIDPYLIPIYDSLYDAIGKENVTKLIEKGTIEVAPLAYMRGRTLDNAIVILDEAQNATTTQMKMFLTRLGNNSKMIITGDLSQIDLPNKNNSGMTEAVNILDNIEGIKMIRFQNSDVMRHPLVFKIIERYDKKYDN